MFWSMLICDCCQRQFVFSLICGSFLTVCLKLCMYSLVEDFHCLMFYVMFYVFYVLCACKKQTKWGSGKRLWSVQLAKKHSTAQSFNICRWLLNNQKFKKVVQSPNTWRYVYLYSDHICDHILDPHIWTQLITTMLAFLIISVFQH